MGKVKGLGLWYREELIWLLVIEELWMVIEEVERVGLCGIVGGSENNGRGGWLDG